MSEIGRGPLRFAVLVSALLVWLALAAGRPPGVLTALLLALAVLSALAPGGVVPAAFVLAVLVVQLQVGGLDGRLAVTVAALAAHHALCALVADLPTDARVRLDALHRPLLRLLAVQAGSLLLVGIALGVRGLHRTLTDPTLLVATVVLVVATSAAGVLGWSGGRRSRPIRD